MAENKFIDLGPVYFQRESYALVTGTDSIKRWTKLSPVIDSLEMQRAQDELERRNIERDIAVIAGSEKNKKVRQRL